MTLLGERAPAVVVDPNDPPRSEPLRAVLLTLPFVVLAELLLMRMFYRVGIFIPKQGTFRTVYAVLSDVGSFAFDLASVLALAALGLLTLVAFRHGNRTLAFVIAAFLISILAARVAGVEAVGPMPRLAFLLALLAVTVPFLRSGAEVAHRLLVAAIAACFVLSTYSGLAQGAGAGWAPGVSGGQLAAELVVVFAAAIAPMAWLRTDGFRLRPPVVAAPLAASFVAGWTANGAVTGILVLWTVGLRLYLAPWIYAVALWAFLTAALGWLPRRPWRSAGLVLLIAGGMLLGSTYQQSLGILAVVLLTDGVAFGGLPALGASDTPSAISGFRARGECGRAEPWPDAGGAMTSGCLGRDHASAASGRRPSAVLRVAAIASARLVPPATLRPTAEPITKAASGVILRSTRCATSRATPSSRSVSSSDSVCSPSALVSSSIHPSIVPPSPPSVSAAIPYPGARLERRFDRGLDHLHRRSWLDGRCEGAE